LTGDARGLGANVLAKQSTPGKSSLANLNACRPGESRTDDRLYIGRCYPRSGSRQAGQAALLHCTNLLRRPGALARSTHMPLGHPRDLVRVAERENVSMAQAAEMRKRGKAKEKQVDRDALLKAYRTMLLIRRFEERAGQLYGMGLIGGFCHLYIGQEAVVVGMQLALSDGDQVITSYRDHGHMLATGMEARGVMAELTGRSGGYSRGKGGSMHMFSKEKKFFGGHGIVGAQVSLGTGLAFSNMYRGTDRVSITYFGEGASNQGQVFESFNLAALMKLPVVYVIENNKYGMGTSVERASASHDLSKNGAPWGIPGMQVDGMDVLAVKDAAEQAVAACRAGNGPFLLEVKTYRYRGHSMSDPAKYRTREEVQMMRTQHDCIESARHRLEALDVDEKTFKGIDDEVKAIIQDAADFAQSSPEPDLGEVFTDVLLEG
jgi:pyruvate dehydrogenase E1 component alpha subunit